MRTLFQGRFCLIGLGSVSTVKRPLVVRDTYLLCPAPVLEKEGT